MGTNWGGAASGAATGATMGSMFGPWGTAIGAVGGGLYGLFSGGSDTSEYDPMSAYTPEQREAIKMLMSLATTGSGGGITLGEKYTGSLGSYDSTGNQTAYDQLMSLYGGSELGTASDVYTRMANNKFNPDDPSSGYAAFSRALAKSGEESASILDRESAITGNRYGTAISKNKAGLSADLSNQRGMFLAELFNQGENRALQGAAGLESIVGTKGNISTTAAQQASIINAMKDAQAKDALDEYKRTRAETLSRIGLMSGQWENPMGTITTTTPSALNSMGMEGGSSSGIMSILSLLSSFKGGGGTVGNTGQTQSQILGTSTKRWS